MSQYRMPDPQIIEALGFDPTRISSYILKSGSGNAKGYPSLEITSSVIHREDAIAETVKELARFRVVPIDEPLIVRCPRDCKIDDPEPCPCCLGDHYITVTLKDTPTEREQA